MAVGVLSQERRVHGVPVNCRQKEIVIIRIIFWIILVLSVCISIIGARTPISILGDDTPTQPSSGEVIMSIVQSAAEGVIWGLALGGLFLIGTKIYHKLKSNWTSTKNRR